MRTTTANPKIYWNNAGMVACENHTPYKGSDTWRWEQWAVITKREAAEWVAELGSAPKCECCDATMGGAA